MTQTKLTCAFLVVCGGFLAQAQDDNAARMAVGQTPVFRITVTDRTAKAINYKHRGEAKVESKQGYIEIEVEFDDLKPANMHGSEYLTYVLWAITPEGRTSNLGEILLNGTKSKLNVTTELQVFGLVVTAEPYYAVSKPSDLIVMENVVRADTVGKVELIDAKYELLQRGQYQRLSNPLALKLDRRLPLELYEARNAVQIARSMGADRYATETFQKAEKSLAQAESSQSRGAGRKPVTMSAREAVQTAEDARAIAVKRQEEDALTAERQRSADREASANRARIAAQIETDRVTRDAVEARIRAQAEADRLTREADRLVRERDAQSAAAQAEADRVKRENDARLAAAGNEADRLRMEIEERATAARNEADRLKRESDAQIALASAEADRLRRESEAQLASVSAEADRLKRESDARLALASAEADRLKRENEAQRAAHQAGLDAAARDKTRLEAEKAELRNKLMAQFNLILQTRDTARGLIVNMSDVLFASGKHTLGPGAREKLAKVAGIVSAYPGLKLDIEGHTDSVGGDGYNQTLSENRGTSVRDYLTHQGMAGSSVTSKGLGESQPVASNDNAAGRQQNRRVEIVISGEVIGTVIGTPIASR